MYFHWSRATCGHCANATVAVTHFALMAKVALPADGCVGRVLGMCAQTTIDYYKNKRDKQLALARGAILF
jgi:hypothetical protein